MLSHAIQLQVSRWGLGNKRKALLVHGLAGCSATWWRLGNELACQEYEVTAPDLRGHGASPIGDRYSFADFANDLVSLGSKWDLIVGHSLGGPIVASLLASGVTATRTVLLDPVFDIPVGSFDAVATDQESDVNPLATAESYLLANPHWHPLDAHAKAFGARSIAKFTVRRVMADNAPWHVSDLLKPITSEVLILGADPNVFSMCPPSLGLVLSAQSNVSFSVVTDSGHSVHRDNPSAVLSSCVG
jgi:pimeloyl-ACP methyl ester carboxylesterase